MLCTNCSRPVKPIVALDIDGTLGDYHGHFERFASEWIGRQRRSAAGPYSGSVRYRQWFADAFNVGDDVFSAVKLAYRQGGQKRSMPVYADADTLTEKLIKAGVEIWLCTTRPYLKHDTIDPDTREWTQRNGILWDHLLYGPDKYKRLVEQVEPQRIVAVLDDEIGRIQEARDLGLTAILRRNRYNRAIQDGYTAQDLDHAVILIKIEIRKWIYQHEGEATHA